jgi:hypothetical protein
MRKIQAMIKDAYYLVRQHKLYFLSPVLILLCALAILCFHFGPSIVVAFIYAGA